MWLNDQKKKINDTNNDFYIKLSENIYVKKSLDDCLKNKDKKLTWNEWKDLLFEFCDINKKCPLFKQQYKNNNIGMWLNDQKKKINDTNNDFYIKLSENIYVKKSLDDYLKKK
jgi:nicotinamide mononucleotide adenylyltransferase